MQRGYTLVFNEKSTKSWLCATIYIKKKSKKTYWNSWEILNLKCNSEEFIFIFDHSWVKTINIQQLYDGGFLLLNYIQPWQG
jgi:hypothetical protein